MTREEMEELKGLAASMGLYDDKKPCKRAVILGKAIKALEQDPILDKIRAEIQNIAFDSQEIDGEHESIMILELNDALNIIDKHKAKSEVEDGECK